jgi:hypothetical protein
MNRLSQIAGLLVIALAIFAVSLGSSTTDKPVAPVIGKAAWHFNSQIERTRQATLKPLPPTTASPVMPSSKSLAFASTCTVYVNEPIQALYDWMVGDEIYYAYQNLQFYNFNCDTTYPFVVTHIGQTLVLNDTGTIVMQAFLASVDPIYSSPACPVPYELIYLSDQYSISIPGPGVYSIVIPLENPTPVSEPYFACIYWANDISAMYPGIAIDSTPYLCINYNDWGEGMTDLADNEYYNFPGSIHLFSLGYSRTGLQPQPRYIIPGDSGTVLPGNAIWVAELRDSIQYESASFEYFKAGQWYKFGADFNGRIALRNGVTQATTDDGWSTVWQPYGLTEGNYLLRVSITDIDSTFISDTISVYYDLKPLEPKFTGRTDKMVVCGAETVTVTIQDENPIAVTFGYRNLPAYEERNLQLLRRNDYGDANGNINDGNHEYNGEFGEYYSAPALFASFFKYWYDKGYIELMADGATILTIPQTVEKLAQIFKTRSSLGTEDDDLVYGLTDHLKTHGGRIVANVNRKPNWEWFKTNYLGEQSTIALAIRNPFGHWLAVQKVNYTNAGADSFPVTYYDPVGGLLRESFLLVRGDSLLLGYLPNNTKYPIDLGIALHTKLETITYLTFGSDFDPINGWQANLQPLQQGLSYLIRARALDANDKVAKSYWMMKYDCSGTFRHGDADGSHDINVADATYIVAFIFSGGPTPVPVRDAGDANCNGTIDISDVVFLIAYIFAGGPAPCL